MKTDEKEREGRRIEQEEKTQFVYLFGLCIEILNIVLPTRYCQKFFVKTISIISTVTFAKKDNNRNTSFNVLKYKIDRMISN